LQQQSLKEDFGIPNKTTSNDEVFMKIMAALDLSDYADFVLKKAIKTAKQQNAKMDIVVVAEDRSDESDSAEWERSNEKRIQDATRAARSYLQKALAQGVKAKLRVLSGKSAAEEIIKYQKSEKLDLIVLGRRSHPRRATYPMGAVAQKVSAYAACTVMVVRCMEKRDIIDWNANNEYPD
jgi:nucleotide-binding universal stress UspA family protein